MARRQSIDALRRIADGEMVIDPTILTLLGRRRRRGTLNLLTPRGLDMFALVAEGCRTGPSSVGWSSWGGRSRRTPPRSSPSSG
jgi:hypothetical protein